MSMRTLSVAVAVLLVLGIVTSAAVVMQNQQIAMLRDSVMRVTDEIEKQSRAPEVEDQVEMGYIGSLAHIAAEQNVERKQQIYTREGRYQMENDGLELVRLVGDKKETVYKDVTQAGIVRTIENSQFGLISQPGDGKVYLVEGSGEMGGVLWSYDIQTKTFLKMKSQFRFGEPDAFGRYQVTLSHPDTDREVRKLHVLDLTLDKEWDQAELPRTESYVMGSSEFDGRPFGQFEWVSEGSVRVDIFNPTVGLTQPFELRKSIKEQTVFISEPVL